jgi:hypothetical protein
MARLEPRVNPKILEILTGKKPKKDKPEPTILCVVCGGKLIKDIKYPPFTSSTKIGGSEKIKGKPDGFHCEQCGIKYVKEPKTKKVETHDTQSGD